MDAEQLRQTIAERIAFYRKRMGMTQLELAERINYSDKSVSKWERGDGVPDVYILVQLAELFGVRIHDLVSAEEPPSQPKGTKGRSHLLIGILAVGIVWLVASMSFLPLYMGELLSRPWLVWLYAIPASAIVLIVFTALWGTRLVQFLSIALLLWSVALCLAVTLQFSGIWLLYVVAGVLQILEVFWFLLRVERSRHRA